MWTKRLDLLDISDGATDYRYAPDHGHAVRRTTGWWISCDQRIALLGNVPNDDLIAPTFGPFPSFKSAVTEYDLAVIKKRFLVLI